MSQMKPVPVTICLIATLLSLCCHTSYGQQRPKFSTESFDYSVRHRQSVCGRQDQLNNGTRQLRDALVGMELHTVLVADDRFFKIDSNGTINKDDPGLVSVLMDELADRAGFSWRNSFGLVGSIILPEGKTYAQLQEWSVETYDISAAYWAKSISRMDLGISYPEGWFDGNLIMIGIQDDGGTQLDLWSFLEPFSAGVWIMIAVTIIVSALVYWFLDWFDDESDALLLGHDPFQNMFLAALSFTGHFEFRPKSNSARIFTISLAFWSLIVMSAYTANLASFLIVQNTPSIEINTVGDAVRLSYPICVLGTTYADELLSRTYKGANIIRTKTETDAYHAVHDGRCKVALSSYHNWLEYSRDRSVNGDCRLTWIGRTFKDLEGGFATKSDSGTLCTSLVRDVVNLHMVEMKETGFLDNAWENYLNRQATIDCDANTLDTEDDSGQLTLQAMGGTFIIHLILTGVAIFMSFFWKCCNKKIYRCRQNESGTEAESNVRDSGLAGGSENFANEMSDQSSMQLQYEEMFQKQDEKLAALAKQNMEMLAMFKAMQDKSHAIRGQSDGHMGTGAGAARQDPDQDTCGIEVAMK